MPAVPELRVALVVPGAASLGAYEAGALTALLNVVRASNGRVAVDTIVGASAGSVGGAVLAHALVTGTGDGDLERLWVDEASIGNLLAGRRPHGPPRAPLSAERLMSWAEAALSHADNDGDPAEPIVFVASIANLQGLDYRIAQPDRGQAIPANTYSDLKVFTLGPECDWPGTVAELIAAAAASGAHPAAFPPVRIERRRAEYPPGVAFPGDTASFWYTDGGTVENEPIGAALDAVYDPAAIGLAGRGRFTEPRLFLLVHPEPATASNAWPPGGGSPSFRRTAVRAFTMNHNQSLYEDLRHLEKVNSRILARRALADALTKVLTDAGSPAEQLLRDAANRAAERKASVLELQGKRTTASRDDDWLERLLDEVSGTRGKEVAQVEIVSPALDPSGLPADRLLAGDRVGSFFGFALRRARANDFALGYRNFRVWWETTGASLGFADVPLAAHPLEQTPAVDLGPADIPRLTRWRLLARLAWRYASAVARP